MRRFIAFGPALVVLVTTLVTLVAAPAAVRMIGYAQSGASVQLARQSLEGEDILDRINKQVRAIAEASSPSVVHIATAEPRGRGFVRQGQGSGWVYDQAGHVVTNSHVVKGARQIFVQFQDGRQVRAEVVGRDPTTDIAVLRVETTEGLFPAQRASGLKLHQGDRVYAFGSPFGFKFSMSEGIVSGLGRDPNMVIGQGGYTNFIQTDAAVNPGNSGGPLMDTKARLVGMNVAIATASNADGTSEGQSSGISFAIPLETIEFVVEQLISTGVVVKGYLGITHPGNDELNSQALGELGYKSHGVVVIGVQADSPADKAGLRKGDVILSFNNEPIWNVPGLRSAISNSPAGKQVEIKIWRAAKPEAGAGSVEEGQELILRPQLATLPPTPLELRETVEALNRFGIADLALTSRKQVVITDVLVPSAAARAGFRPGMVVIEVNGKLVSSLDGLLSELAAGGLAQGRDASLTTSDQDGQGKQSLSISGAR